MEQSSPREAGSHTADQAVSHLDPPVPYSPLS